MGVTRAPRPFVPETRTAGLRGIPDFAALSSFRMARLHTRFELVPKFAGLLARLASGQFAPLYVSTAAMGWCNLINGARALALG